MSAIQYPVIIMVGEQRRPPIRIGRMTVIAGSGQAQCRVIWVGAVVVVRLVAVHAVRWRGAVISANVAQPTLIFHGQMPPGQWVDAVVEC